MAAHTHLTLPRPFGRPTLEPASGMGLAEARMTRATGRAQRVIGPVSTGTTAAGTDAWRGVPDVPGASRDTPRRAGPDGGHRHPAGAPASAQSAREPTLDFLGAVRG